MNLRRKLDDCQSVTTSIGHLVSPLLYPSHSVKCVTTDNGHRFTRDALTLLENLDIEHPVGQYVYGVCRSFSERFGTGADQLVYFISSWTRAAQMLCDMGIPSAAVVQLLSTVIEGCIEHTDILKITVADALDKITDRPANLDDNIDRTDILYVTADVGCSKVQSVPVSHLDRDEKLNLESDTTEDPVDMCEKFDVPSDDYEYINGIKIVKLMMNNTDSEGTAVSNALEVDISWFFTPSNASMLEHASGEDKDCHSEKIHDSVPYSQKQDGPLEESIDKRTCTLKMESAIAHSDHELPNFLNNSPDAVKRLAQESRTTEGTQSSIGQSNDIEELESYDDLKNELATLKNDIEMDILRIKQGNKKLKKESSHIEVNNDVEFDSCFEHSDDEFESCFDDSIKTESNDLSQCSDCISPDEEFKTIQLTFQKEPNIIHNRSDAMSCKKEVCKEIETESENHQDKNCKNETIVKSSSRSKGIGVHVKKETDCNRHIDNDDFDSMFDDKIVMETETGGTGNSCKKGNTDIQGVSSQVATKPKSDTAKVGQGNPSSVNKSQLHDINDILKSLGKDTKTSSGKPVKIASRHSQSSIPDVDDELKISAESDLTTSPEINEDISKPVVTSKLQGMDNLLKNLGKDTKISGRKPMKIASRHLQSTIPGVDRERDSGTETDLTTSHEINDGIAKPVVTSKLQDMDNLLKSLGKQTSGSQFSAKSVRIASRHLSETEDNAECINHIPEYDSVELRNCKDLNSKENYRETEMAPQGLTETSDKLEKPLNTEHSGRVHKGSLENNSSADKFNSMNFNYLLKGLDGEMGSKPSEEDKSKFKSDMLIRSRHFGAEAETEDVCRDEATGCEGDKDTDEAGRREKVSQFVTRLNYGSDRRLVNIVTEALQRQSTDQTLSLLPAYVQTHNMVGGQREPQLVQGLVLQASHTQAEAAHRLAGRHCNLLIVNGDITSSYRHRGYKSVKTTRTLSVDTFTGHVTKSDQWTCDVTDTLKQLYINIVLARGSISEDFQDVCSGLGVVIIESVPYRRLSLLSEAAKITMVTYVTLATQENVCQSALISPWQPDGGDTPSVCVAGSCRHTVVVSIPGASIQTVVLGNYSQTLLGLEEEVLSVGLHRTGSALQAGLLFCSLLQTVVLGNHTETLLGLEEEALSVCLHRTGSSLHEGLVLPGAGYTEMACYGFCFDMTEKLLKESQREEANEENQYLVTAYEVVAESFHEYHRLVQHNCALVQNETPDCVYDDYRSKVEAWRTALDTVCTILCSDYHIMTGVTEEHRLSHDYVIL